MSLYIKTFANNEDHQMNMLKVDHEVSWEGKDNHQTSIHKKGFEDIVTSLQTFLDNQASIGGNRMPNESMEAPHCKQVHEPGLVEKQTKNSSDKVVTKIKVPEVIVCFNDGACQIVKDICIDEGLHPLEKILFETSEVSEKISSVLKSNVKYEKDDPGKEMDNGAAPITEDMKATCNLDKDNDDYKSSWSSAGTGERPSLVNETRSNIYVKEINLDMLSPTAKANTDPHLTDQEKEDKDALEDVLSSTTWASFTSDSDSTYTQPSKDENYTGRTTISFGDTDHSQTTERMESSIDQITEESSLLTLLQSDILVSEQSNGNHETYATNEMESGVESSEYKSESTTTRDSDANRADTDSEPFLKVHNPLIMEEMAPDSSVVSKGSSYLNNNQEETNFSGPSYLSGAKVSSGHIAYSGNISIRSDSTTSIRSFAFPVLQSEWNTSPVKMAKADRRRLRKYQCWGIRFCCKF